MRVERDHYPQCAAPTSCSVHIPLIGVHRSFGGRTETAALIYTTLHQCIFVKGEIHFTHASVPIDTLNEEWHSTFSTRMLLIGFTRPADPGNQCGNNKCPQASTTLARIPLYYASLELLQLYVYWDFAIVRQLFLLFFLASHRSVVHPVESSSAFSRAFDLGKLMVRSMLTCLFGLASEANEAPAGVSLFTWSYSRCFGRLHDGRWNLHGHQWQGYISGLPKALQFLQGVHRQFL